MFIVINCLGMPFNGETIKGKSLGGSETAAYYIAKELAAEGHRVTVFTAEQQEGVWDDVKYVYAGHVTERTPLGDRFHYYAEHTPHDVLIIQRHPQAFRYRWASKVNLWWVHDLGMVRLADEVRAQLWNIDGILTVSDFHKNQIAEVYGINPDIIYPIQNGVDLRLFDGAIETFLCADGSLRSSPEHGIRGPDAEIKLLYSSRPERGLEHLLAHNGIMERLHKIDERYHLFVCGYDNTTEQMRPYYEYLWKRCDELPNVTLLGALTKQQLADVMRQCQALVYPTPGPQQPDFEEVSCITAMEAMAAGLPFISSNVGALSETCRDSGSILIPHDDNCLPNVQVFVDVITEFFDERPHGPTRNGADFRDLQKEAAVKYDWPVAAGMLLGHITAIFNRGRSPDAVCKDLLRNSDIYALAKYIEDYDLGIAVEDFFDRDIYLRELDTCYSFAFSTDPKDWEDHYERYYQYEKERGVNYGPENLSHNDRFEYVSGCIDELASGAVVLDYGCAHGHYTINLAKRHPDKMFIGVDLAYSNVEKARSWAEEGKIDNATFLHGQVINGEIVEVIDQDTSSALSPNTITFDCIIAAEVVEHVGNPEGLVDVLNLYLKADGQMIITVPFGPWEAQGYIEHYPWRAHLWHFDKADLHEMFGHFPDFGVAVIPAGRSRWGSQLGSHAVTYSKPDAQVGKIDYFRKFSLQKPTQTVSTCMIVYNAEDTLLRTLNSVKDFSDEIILAIDPKTSDNTCGVIENFKKNIEGGWPVVRVIDGLDPMVAGFDEARNHSIQQAHGDWILWIDADEVLVHPEQVTKYLRNNSFDGYAIKQHHFAVEPLGVIKTDLPCRMFRNNKGIRFFGVVHEHPELGLNKGAGHVQLLPDVEIAHYGYTTEGIRRGRFDRNIDLLHRDRQKYPDRVLGKFLWIRDLAQMCRYDLEANGGHITGEMKQAAIEGIALWEDLLEAGHLRMLIDGIEFYDILAQIHGDGFQAGFTLDTSKANGGLHLDRVDPVVSHFVKKEHVEKLMRALFDEKTKTYDSRYF